LIPLARERLSKACWQFFKALPKLEPIPI